MGEIFYKGGVSGEKGVGARRISMKLNKSTHPLNALKGTFNITHKIFLVNIIFYRGPNVKKHEILV